MSLLNSQKSSIAQENFKFFDKSQSQSVLSEQRLSTSEYHEFIKSHSRLVEFENTKLKQLERKLNPDRKGPDKNMNVNDLSRDFMQIINLSNQKGRKDSNVLYCQIDPASRLFEPIEALRRNIFREVYDQEDEDSSSGDEMGEDKAKMSAKDKKIRRQISYGYPFIISFQYRQLEKYMDSVEQQSKKRAGQTLNMEIIKDLHFFYQNCLTQLLSKLGSVNIELKRVSQRIFNGFDVLFQAIVRHHIKEVQYLNEKIQKKDVIIYLFIIYNQNTNSALRQDFEFLKNDIKMINEMVPRVNTLIDQTIKSQDRISVSIDTQARHRELYQSTRTKRDEFMDGVIKNEQQLYAISEIEKMLETRNLHQSQKKAHVLAKSIDQFKSSNVEQHLKNILYDIRDVQGKQEYNDSQFRNRIEMDENEYQQELDKQQKVIRKDWTGERNQKIRYVQKRLVDQMWTKLNRLNTKTASIQTDIDFVPIEVYNKIDSEKRHFENEVQIMIHMIKNKDIERDALQKAKDGMDIQLQKVERQLYEIKMLSKIKKNFIITIKNEYEEIIMDMLNNSMKFALTIKKENKTLTDKEQDGQLQRVLNIQLKKINQYMSQLEESKKFAADQFEFEKQSNSRNKSSLQDKQSLDKSPGSRLNIEKIKSTDKSNNSKDESPAQSSSSSSSDSENDTPNDILMSRKESTHHADVVKRQEIDKLQKRFSIAPSLLRQQILKLNSSIKVSKEDRSKSVKVESSSRDKPKTTIMPIAEVQEDNIEEINVIKEEEEDDEDNKSDKQDTQSEHNYLSLPSFTSSDDLGKDKFGNEILKKSMDLQEIKEDALESSSMSRVASATKGLRDSQYGMFQQRKSTLTNIKMLNREIQTDSHLGMKSAFVQVDEGEDMTLDYDLFEDVIRGRISQKQQQLIVIKEEIQNKKQKDVMATLQQIVNNEVEFKSEMMSNQGFKTLSEAKINQIRKVFVQIMNKAQVETKVTTDSMSSKLSKIIIQKISNAKDKNQTSDSSSFTKNSFSDKLQNPFTQRLDSKEGERNISSRQTNSRERLKKFVQTQIFSSNPDMRNQGLPQSNSGSREQSKEKQSDNNSKLSGKYQNNITQQVQTTNTISVGIGLGSSSNKAFIPNKDQQQTFRDSRQQVSGFQYSNNMTSQDKMQNLFGPKDNGLLKVNMTLSQWKPNDETLFNQSISHVLDEWQQPVIIDTPQAFEFIGKDEQEQTHNENDDEIMNPRFSQFLPSIANPNDSIQQINQQNKASNKRSQQTSQYSTNQQLYQQQVQLQKQTHEKQRQKIRELQQQQQQSRLEQLQSQPHQPTVKVMSMSKSQPKLHIPQQPKIDYKVIPSHYPEKFNEQVMDLVPNFTDYRLDVLNEAQKQKDLEFKEIQKSLVQSHIDLKQAMEDKKSLGYRDRKQSIDNLLKSGVASDTKSYSKEGKRLDYHTFDNR